MTAAAVKDEFNKRKPREEMLMDELLPKSKKSKTNGKKEVFGYEKKKGRSRTGYRLEALLSTPVRSRQIDCEDQIESTGLKRSTLSSWLIFLGVVNENAKIRYVTQETEVLSEGRLTHAGILCNCCEQNFSFENFQLHSGTGVHRTTAQLILYDGRSLFDCELEALKKIEEQPAAADFMEDIEIDENDDTCGVCGDGGQLICCDHCPSTFHLKCVLLSSVPKGDWFCPKCRCAICGGSQFSEKGHCNKMEVLYCHQCEREYHIDCIFGEDSPAAVPSSIWFCSLSCQKIFKGLRRLVGIKNALNDNFSWILLRNQQDDEEGDTDSLPHIEITTEYSSKIALALSVMQECFRPMVDPRTKTDIIKHIMYNRRAETRRIDFRGFYTIMLESADELISVAAIRLHGAHIAEMPLIGTRFQYRRQGMCRRLMNVIEQVLYTLGVESLVLPAVPEFLETWTGAFGFQKLTSPQGLHLMDLNIVAFPGTKILQKPLTWLTVGKRVPPPTAENTQYELLNHTKQNEEDVEKKCRSKKSKEEKKMENGVFKSLTAIKRDVRNGKTNKKIEDCRKTATSAKKISEESDAGECLVQVPLQYGQLQRDGHSPVLLSTGKYVNGDSSSSRVIVAKTRSNRVVKSSPWVADALKDMRRGNGRIVVLNRKIADSKVVMDSDDADDPSLQAPFPDSDVELPSPVEWNAAAAAASANSKEGDHQSEGNAESEADEFEEDTCVADVPSTPPKNHQPIHKEEEDDDDIFGKRNDRTPPTYQYARRKGIKCVFGSPTISTPPTSSRTSTQTAAAAAAETMKTTALSSRVVTRCAKRKLVARKAVLFDVIGIGNWPKNKRSASCRPQAPNRKSSSSSAATAAAAAAAKK